jgi:hypothetical protein
LYKLTLIIYFYLLPGTAITVFYIIKKPKKEKQFNLYGLNLKIIESNFETYQDPLRFERVPPDMLVFFRIKTHFSVLKNPSALNLKNLNN